MCRAMSFLLLRIVSLVSFLCVTSRNVRAASLGLFAVKEAIQPPQKWATHGDPLPTQKIVLRIALPQPRFGVLQQHLLEISDPTHIRYGQHLSKATVENLVAPPQESIDAVHKWLEMFNITHDQIVRSPAQDWIMTKVPVDLVQRMLNTVSLRAYTHPRLLSSSHRHIMYGNTLKLDTPSLEQLSIAYRKISIGIST